MINFQVGDEVEFKGVWYKVVEVRPSVSEPGLISPRIIDRGKGGSFKCPSSIDGYKPMVMENI